MTKKKHLNQRQHQRIADNEQRRLKRSNKASASDWDDALLHPPEPGLVLSRFGQHADVEDTSGAVVRCNMRRTISSVVTGDQVSWRRSKQPTGSIDGVIEAVAERHSVLLRPDFYDGLKPVAANIDLMIIVSAIMPALSLNIIDRYLVASEITGIKPLLVINKIDLLPETEQQALDQQLQLYRQMGYACLLVSAKTGQGMAELLQYLHSGTSIFVGQSGVGKSSLMNTLMPGLAAATQEVSEVSGLGQHTTTVSRLYHLPEGGKLIDSPGIREFALWHLSPEEVTNGFIEFRPWLGRCKFRDCKHLTDPGCAIQHAVAEGEISPLRYESYQKILHSMAQDKPHYF
ncbi:GTPase RsgA [Alishewanella sp. WH16-1]|uniref:small ribosomal subunit biogenesis GTPase RsgA n=1 Tax=Alishewanella sp. WH16-1 TaxID=1651088 RepID=UPI000710D599|nr:small ribosomal subunit biogenesis GTPase RsgA [Alishewanella sp. WH16-1]KRS20953.1 GTPase RsgA [Alishewanella sp. WH16-1]